MRVFGFTRLRLILQVDALQRFPLKSNRARHKMWLWHNFQFHGHKSEWSWTIYFSTDAVRISAKVCQWMCCSGAIVLPYCACDVLFIDCPAHFHVTCTHTNPGYTTACMHNCFCWFFPLKWTICFVSMEQNCEQANHQRPFMVQAVMYACECVAVCENLLKHASSLRIRANPSSSHNAIVCWKKWPTHLNWPTKKSLRAKAK